METLYRRVMTREGYTFDPVDIDSLKKYTVGVQKPYEEGGGFEYHTCIRYDDLKKTFI